MEIQALLRDGNLRAIDMAQELLDLTSGDMKIELQGLLDAAKLSKFHVAEKAAQSLLEGLH